MQAIKDIRHLAKDYCFVSGMSAVVTDTKDLAEHEEPIYVMIAVALATIVLAICMDSYIIPLIFLLGIVMAKGVIFGVIGSVTILPSMILVFDKLI